MPEYRDLTGHVRKISDLYFAYGGFSEVYKGIYQDETGSQHEIAIKIIRGAHISANTQATIMRRLDREAKVWHSLRHPNVLEFLGIALGLGPSVALISPFCTNGNVTKYIDDVPNANRLHLILGVANGVEYLHKNDVIHGDIKGHNVLVAGDGKAMLSDFGRAKIINHRGFTTANFAGAARYMAPELIVSGIEIIEDDTEQGDIDNYNPSDFLSKESDIYSFSMVGVEILSGEQPYPRLHNDTKIILKVPDGLRPKKEDYQLSRLHEQIWNILELCWVHEPAQRLTISTVVQRLSRLS